jgi:hypothetical protein
MKKNILFLLLMLLLAGISLQAQIDKMKDILEEETDLAAEGKLVLHFFDALTNQPVPLAAVSIMELGDFTTTLDGAVVFEKPQTDKRYTFSFTADGYIPFTDQFEVVAGTIFANRFFASPVLEIGSMRIVLEWNNKPADLDLHLIKQNEYHISYRDKKISDDGKAQLDRDAQKGYGPETITLSNLDEQAIYSCYVQDYTNRDKPKSKQLSKSEARVKLYMDGELMQVLRISEKQQGNRWNLFEIKNGNLIPDSDLIKTR